MTNYYIWFTFFAIIAYFIVTDNSVAKAIYILTQLLKIQYEKIKWLILYNPENPIVKWIMWRRAIKMAKELERDILSKKDS